MNIADTIKKKAIALGFDCVGIASSEALPQDQQEAFVQWLEAGYAGPMEYLHRNLDKRFTPQALLTQAKSIVVVGLNYNPGPPPDNAPIRSFGSW